METKTLQVRITPIEASDKAALVVTEQSHHGDKFHDGGMFTASNGQRLASTACPFMGNRPDVLYVRGNAAGGDNYVVVIPSALVDAVEQAVAEYNFIHSAMAEEYEIVRWDTKYNHLEEMLFDIHGVISKKWLILRRKADCCIDIAEKAFYGSNYTKQYRVRGTNKDEYFRIPLPGEWYFAQGSNTPAKCTNCERASFTKLCDSTVYWYGRRLILEPIERTVDDLHGEELVGLLCRVSDYEILATSKGRSTIITDYHEEKGYRAATGLLWKYAKPLSKEELQQCMDKLDAALKKDQ